MISKTQHNQPLLAHSLLYTLMYTNDALTRLLNSKLSAQDLHIQQYSQHFPAPFVSISQYHPTMGFRIGVLYCRIGNLFDSILLEILSVR